MIELKRRIGRLKQKLYITATNRLTYLLTCMRASHCCYRLTRNIISRQAIFLLTIALIFLPGIGYSQPDTTRNSAVVNVASLRFSHKFTDEIAIANGSKDLPAERFSELSFSHSRYQKMGGTIPGEFIEQAIYLRFFASNPADTVRSLSFIPGYYSRDIEAYKRNLDHPNNKYTKMDVSGNEWQRKKGVAPITLDAQERAEIILKIQLLRTNSNRLSPRLVEEDFVPHWYRWRKAQEQEQDMVTYIASGILLLMIFYSLAVFLQNKSVEFLYYSAYALCMATLLFLKSFLNLHHSAFNFFYEEYLDLIIMCTGVFFYLLFVRKFINSTVKYAYLDKFLRGSVWGLWILLFIYSLIYFFTDRYLILNIVENFVIKMMLVIIGITFIIYSFKRKDRLINYIAAGNFALVFFSVISLLLMTTRLQLLPEFPRSLLNRSMFHYELGLVLELMLFLAGLAYKNRRDIIFQVRERERFKLENERQEFEKQMAVMNAQQQERNRISADMHDELGSGVTAIRLMSEIVKSKLKDISLPEIDKISNSANELLNKMNTIIWTMKSSNDTLESLTAYTRAYAIEYFDATNVSCTVNIAVIPEVEMSGEKRRNIFLSIKEALNNILKHAHASRVQIDLLTHHNKLIIRISDNGVGINPDTLRRFGNGLSNIRKRMQSIQGTFKLKNENGTILILEIPLTSDEVH